jgi:meiotically up-regulated gene 157 (Mug157) protein
LIIELRKVSKILIKLQRYDLSQECLKLSDEIDNGIKKNGIVKNNLINEEIYPYEIDGYG